MKDQDFGPTIGAGARRDPTLSIRPHLEPLQPRARREIPTDWARHFLFAVLVLTATAGALILLGGVLHVLWNVIMIGWRLL